MALSEQVTSRCRRIVRTSRGIHQIKKTSGLPFVALLVAMATTGANSARAEEEAVDVASHPLADHLGYKLRGSGEWRTQNPDYDPSDPNSPAFFGVNLHWAPEGQHLTGEVVGLTQDGRSARYQTIYVIFNPETEKVVVQQIGWNGDYAYGEQVLRKTDLQAGDSDVLDMKVSSSNRRTQYIRHRDTVLDANRYRSEVLVQDDDGSWTLQREWVWRRVTPANRVDR